MDRVFTPEWQGDHKRVTLRWGTLTALAASTTPYLFGSRVVLNLNSLYDTMYGQVQAYMFDTLSGLYRRYKVDGCRIRIRFLAYSSYPTYCGLRVHAPGDASDITGLDLTAVIERPRTHVLANTTGAPPAEVSFSIDFAELCGMTKAQFYNNIEDYAALVSASPARIPFLECAVASSYASAVGNVEWHVEFDARFWSPILVPDA